MGSGQVFDVLVGGHVFSDEEAMVVGERAQTHAENEGDDNFCGCGWVVCNGLGERCGNGVAQHPEERPEKDVADMEC